MYLWLKAFHLFAVILWMGGTLAAGLALAYVARGGRTDVLAIVRRWDMRVTTPAMAAVWVLGLWMVVQAGWWPAGWLLAKLVFVIVLSALHGMLSGSLRRLSADPDQAPPMPIRVLLPAALVSLAVVVVMVVVKPF